MKITDKALLRLFSGPGCCEWCGIRTMKREPHHVYGRGAGGGTRLDIPCNMIALCGAFEEDCHGRAQRYQITRKQILERVGRREGRSPASITREIYRLRRKAK